MAVSSGQRLRAEAPRRRVPSGCRARRAAVLPPPPLRTLFLPSLLLLLFGWCLPLRMANPTAWAAATDEYEVKAALLLNIARFTEWPSAAFREAGDPIVIGILGDDPFGLTLERILTGETVQGRSFLIRRSTQLEDLRPVHLLFVSRSERDRLAQVLADVSEASILTVGEIEDFARRGGVVNFYIDDHKVRFEINAAAAERKGLKLSSQLLRRAKIVGPVPARRGD